MKLSLDQEIHVTNQINGLVGLARKANDYITINFLQWFLTEQLEEVSSMDHLLKIVERLAMISCRRMNTWHELALERFRRRQSDKGVEAFVPVTDRRLHHGAAATAAWLHSGERAMTFKDHFSKQAADYAKFRPRYPQKFFDYLGGIAPSRQVAGIAAPGMDKQQLDWHQCSIASLRPMRVRSRSRTRSHMRIVDYRVAPAENSGIGSETIDLIMVAQALHWFDLDRFYEEARRVLKPGGILAASAYNLLHIEQAIDEVVNRYYYEVVGPFWPPERKLVEQFADLPFPFQRSIRRNSK